MSEDQEGGDEGKGEYTYDFHEERKKEKDRERDGNKERERDGSNGTDGVEASGGVAGGIPPSESSSIAMYNSASELSDNGTEDEGTGGGPRRGGNGGRRRVTMMAGKVISRRRLRVTGEDDDKDTDNTANSQRNNNDDLSTDTPSLPVKKTSASFIVHPTNYNTTATSGTGSETQSPSQPSTQLAHNPSLIIQHKSASNPLLLPPRSRAASPSTPAVTTNTTTNNTTNISHTPSPSAAVNTIPSSLPTASPVSTTPVAPLKRICTPVWNEDLDARWVSHAKRRD